MSACMSSAIRANTSLVELLTTLWDLIDERRGKATELILLHRWYLDVTAHREHLGIPRP